MNLRPDAERTLTRIGVAASLGAAISPAAFLALWFLGWPPLMAFAAYRMKTNTSIALFLLSAAVLLAALGRMRRASVALAAVAALVGALTLFQYASGLSLGIDELVARDLPTPESARFPNRMSPNAAFGLVTGGLGLILLRAGPRASRLGQILALLTLVDGGLAIVGYAYNTPLFYRPTTFIRISPYTSVSLILLGLAMVTLRPQDGAARMVFSAGAGGYTARLLLPAILAIPVISGALSLAGARIGLYAHSDATAMLVVATIAFLGLVVALAARQLDALDARRRASEEHIRLAAEVNDALSGAATVDEVGAAAVKTGLRALGGAAASLMVATENGRSLRIIRTSGYSEDAVREYIVSPMDAPYPANEAFRGGEPIFIASPEEYERLYPRIPSEHIRRRGTRSWAALPLPGRERTLGVLAVSFDEPQTFDAATRARWQRLASHCGQAMDRALLFDAQAAQAVELARLADAHQTARREAEDQSRINATLSRLAASFAKELDEKRLMQLITDEATSLVGARFGAFFFNVTDENGDAYMLHTLSGADQAAFTRFPMPRATPIFAPTFRGEATMRLDDVTKDPRFSRMGPQPEGHPRVSSYLAVPVLARSGGVLGGLFFGHPEPGRFTALHERLVEGVASHASIAIENARLYAALRDREMRLAAAYDAAKAADRRKDEFLALLGHELRNPLAPIATATELMKLKGSTAVEREREIIERQVQHLSRLVDDLLDVSRITRGKLELARERVELASVVAKAVEMASPLLEKRAHRLQVDVPPSGLPVYGDPMRLSQVILNLLTNAAKYSREGAGVHLAARVEEHEAVITVTDEGMGIAPDLMPRIFDMFVQGGRALDRSEGGLGLGLTLVRSLVELHDGTVSAESDGPGRGSRFTVRLPLAAARAVGAAVEPAAAQSPVAGGGCRVLVVDDNEDGAAMLVQLLALAGHQTRVCHDGGSALDLVRQHPVEVAILDIGLPVLDGYEVARRLRAMREGRDLTLIAVTGYGQDSDREKSRAAGFDHHLTKPVEPAVLLSLVAAAKRAGARS